MTSVQISFLGTGAGTSIDRAHTAIVLDWEGGPRILLDASSGNSLLRHGAQLGMPATSFSQVLISHHHYDHMGGLPHLQGQRTFLEPEGAPLQVHCSEESAAGVMRLFQATSITHSVNREGVASAGGKQLVTWHPVQNGRWLDLGFGVGALAFPVDHISGALGWRIERDGLAVVFSGDTRFSPRLVEAAQGARVLIHEALSIDAEQESTALVGHSTAGEAARSAERAGASELIMTHINTAFHDQHGLLIDEARQHFSGPIAVAGDLYQVTVDLG
jgi:ribonuclease Z